MRRGGRVDFIRIAAPITAIIASTAAFAQQPMSAVSAKSAFNWSGFYVGLNAGGSWYDGGTVAGAAVVPPASIAGIPMFGSSSPGFTGGGLAGYNYQIGRGVVGAEADFNYLNLRSQREGGTSRFGLLTETFSIVGRSQVDWFGTLRVRLGAVPVERLLLYGTGGLAYGKVETNEANSKIFVSIQSNNGYIDSADSRFWQGSGSEIKLGWTAGIGAEYAVTPQVAVRAEYLHVDLGKSNAVESFQATAPVQSQIFYTTSHDNKFSVARAAITYKF
jgi:outer membrane immunogenic protein